MSKTVTLIYGTGNPAKLAHMRAALEPLGVNVEGMNDVCIPVPQVYESGATPIENARAKALTYYSAFSQPVFSCDSGLYIGGLADELQPGVNVRNVGGQRLSDDEMIAHYSGLIAGIGGRAVARYMNGICLVMTPEEVYEYDGDDIAGANFLLVSEPHVRRVKGFPLDSLSVHMGSGSYYYDMDSKGLMDKTWYEGFRRFFAKALRL